MKHLFLTSAAALATLALHPLAGAGNVDVGVSVQISQPGVYGRVDIGRFPQPQVVVAQPVIIAPPPPRPGVVVVQPAQPVYLWVPPGHRKHWSKHCGAYNACGVPVYFVRDDWYESHVYPEGKNKGNHKAHGKGD
jgi:hypothetical protein